MFWQLHNDKEKMKAREEGYSAGEDWLDRHNVSMAFTYMIVPRSTRLFKNSEGKVGVILVRSPRDSRTHVQPMSPSRETPEAVSSPIVTEELHSTIAEPASCKPTIKSTMAEVKNSNPITSKDANDD